MSEIHRITVDPGQCGGRPCLRGLRIRDEGLAARLVVPRPIAVAGFHGRDDVNQPGMLAALCQHLSNPTRPAA